MGALSLAKSGADGRQNKGPKTRSVAKFIYSVSGNDPLPTDGNSLLALGLKLSGSRCSIVGSRLERLVRRRRSLARSLLLLFVDALNIFGAGFSVEEAALFHRTTRLHTGVVLMREQHVANAVGAVDRAREVGDVLGNRMLAAHGSGIDAVAFACFTHGIVAAVKVLAFFEVLGEMVAFAG